MFLLSRRDDVGNDEQLRAFFVWISGSQDEVVRAVVVLAVVEEIKLSRSPARKDGGAFQVASEERLEVKQPPVVDLDSMEGHGPGALIDGTEKVRAVGHWI